ncbi:hypothetical protein KFE96_18100 [Kordiimonas sp. SCSIO 12603]|uniref:hypothetical protein n=1 Tax=Kordiimonas sp. SCSIO 12603 TaxID=2829596 RepID=UPI002102D272|nr:hypothetical protein [Kordiimonas sp. SCSIO 12603]UTW58701.1 hypothetical protein KFE96_18100 [Kordiimonas sp. SCSIO 12603]
MRKAVIAAVLTMGLAAPVISTASEAVQPPAPALSQNEQASIQAAINAVLNNPNLTAAQIQAQIAAIVASSSNPGAAASLVTVSVSNASSTVQAAVGAGLAQAATTLQTTNPGAAASVQTAVASAPATVRSSYTTNVGRTGTTPTTPLTVVIPTIPTIRTITIEPSQSQTGSGT